MVGLLAGACSTAPEPRQDPGDVIAVVRGQLLRGSAAEFQVEPVEGIWGVVMETGYEEGAATLVALADGSASLYFSTGGGLIGGGRHPNVATAARRLVDRAVPHRPGLSAVSEFPLPAHGDVHFYVLTTEAVLRAGAPEEALAGSDHPLSDLFFAGHVVITELRKVSEERQGGG